MNRLAPIILFLALLCACGGSVQVGRGTEIKEEQENSPAARAKPPEGNIGREQREPEVYPFITVDLEQPKSPPAPSEPEPAAGQKGEPGSGSKPAGEIEAESDSEAE
jgi:hypothetical protein